MRPATTACLALVSLLVLTGCPDPRQSDPVAPAPVTSLGSWTNSSWTAVPEADTSRDRKLTFSVDLGATPGDLYFVFTNTSATGGPVSLASLAVPGGARSAQQTAAGPAADDQTGPFLDRDETGLPPRPGLQRSLARSAAPLADTPAAEPAVGDSLTFSDWVYANADYRQVPAHLRYKAGPFHGRTLCLWVADDVWTTQASGRPDVWAAGVSSVPGLQRGFSAAMAAAYGARFLNAGTDDIYSSVTAIFGPEWAEGATGYTNLISGTGTLHILVANLNPTGAGSYPAGYFDSSNNYLRTGTNSNPDSNEKLMFFLNSDSLSEYVPARPWSAQSSGPRYMVSALAHEFQHMIHFYQKDILRGGSSDSWVNEMSSMVAEDLVSDRLGVEGPRGVPLLADGTFDYSAGSGDTNWGRLNTFVPQHAVTSLTDWGDLSQASYANAYAFGAWAVRNFGGPALFRSLVQRAGGDAAAVVAAVNDTTGRHETFASLVRWWGLATLMQSSAGSPDPINWGLGGAAANHTVTGAVDGASWSFHLGSIDLGRYDYRVGSTWTSGVPYALPGDTPPDLPSGASWFQRRLTAATGVQSFTLDLPARVQVTAVQLR